MMKQLLHDRRYRRAAWLVLLPGLLLTAVCCAYWYWQRQEWKQVNDQICSFSLAQRNLTEREQILQRWRRTDGDVLDIVQQQADRHGLQVVSFYASPQEKGRYEIELYGSYSSCIHFFNAVEQQNPWLFVSLVRMEGQHDHVSAVIHI